MRAGNRHNVTRGHFALLRLELAISKDPEVAASHHGAVLRQLSHLSTGYPIHHFRGREHLGELSSMFLVRVLMSSSSTPFGFLTEVRMP